MIHTHNNMRHDDFFKFYFVYSLITLLYSSALGLAPAFFDHPLLALNSWSMIIFSSLATIMGLAGFILNIVAIVLISKRRYRKIFLLLPISFFVAGVMSAIFGTIISMQLLVEQYNALGSTVSPEEWQALANDLAQHPPLSITIFSIVRTVVLMALTIGLFILSRRATEPSSKAI